MIDCITTSKVVSYLNDDDDDDDDDDELIILHQYFAHRRMN